MSSERWTASNSVAIVGVGYSELGRRLPRPLGLLARDAAVAAVFDAGLNLADIDGMSTYPDMPIMGSSGTDRDGIGTVSVDYMLRATGLKDSVRWYNQNSVGLLAGSIIQAALAIAAGACNYALVWRGMHMPRGRYHSWRDPVASGNFQFTVPYGVLQGSVAVGMAYQDYMHRFGLNRENFGNFIVRNRRAAQRNPRSYFRDTLLSMDEYLSARMIAEPLSIFDCDLPLDGCAAFVLARADRATDLRQKPVHIRGWAQGTDPGVSNGVYRLRNLDYQWEAGESFAKKLWASAGLTHKDVQAAMIYDAFSPFVLWWLESLGFCRRGEAWQFLDEQAEGQPGRLAINTSGGSLGEGRMHGATHVAEAVYQLTGRAEERQAPDIEHALVTIGPPGLANGGIILSRSAS